MIINIFVDIYLCISSVTAFKLKSIFSYMKNEKYCENPFLSK